MIVKLVKVNCFFISTFTMCGKIHSVKFPQNPPIYQIVQIQLVLISEKSDNNGANAASMVNGFIMRIFVYEFLSKYTSCLQICPSSMMDYCS